jgi:hypothetical protein
MGMLSASIYSATEVPDQALLLTIVADCSNVSVLKLLDHLSFRKGDEP